MQRSTRFTLLWLVLAASLAAGVTGCGPGVFDPGPTSYYRLQPASDTGQSANNQQPAQPKEARP